MIAADYGFSLRFRQSIVAESVTVSLDLFTSAASQPSKYPV